MYAVIESGGKQYLVEEGAKIRLELLDAAVGDQVTFDRVLAVQDGSQFHVGTPFLDNARVTGRVTDRGKGKKIIVFKYKAKKNYRRKQGHRQPYMEVEIQSIAMS
jgi:large subunit ribosomal protein L21